jgi:hypothetical protein
MDKANVVLILYQVLFYHSTIQKNEIVLCRKTDGTGNYQVKQNKSD